MVWLIGENFKWNCPIYSILHIYQVKINIIAKYTYIVIATKGTCNLLSYCECMVKDYTITIFPLMGINIHVHNVMHVPSLTYYSQVA